MIGIGSSGIVRTGGSDGCGAAGDIVTASPEEHEDMPGGGGEVRKVGGLGLGWVGIPLTLLQVTGGECSQSERALLGSGRLLALWKANSQPPTIGTDPREGSTNKLA